MLILPFGFGSCSIYISYNEQIINTSHNLIKWIVITIYISYNEQIINLSQTLEFTCFPCIYISYNEQIINPLSGIKLHK